MCIRDNKQTNDSPGYSDIKQWNLSVTTTSKIKFITRHLLSNEF